MDNDENINFMLSRKRQKTDHKRSVFYFDENLFNKKLEIINKCTLEFYNRYEDLRTEPTLSEFIPCCTNEEKELLKECILTIKEHTNLDDETIYSGVIGYYYMTIVNEYYVLIGENFGETYFYVCFKNLFYKNSGRKLVDLITTSDEEWASFVRQKINFGSYKRKQPEKKCNEGDEGCTVNGGKKRKTNKRKTYKKKLYKKHKKTNKRSKIY
jgi:hypothetical protein